MEAAAGDIAPRGAGAPAAGAPGWNPVPAQAGSRAAAATSLAAQVSTHGWGVVYVPPADASRYTDFFRAGEAVLAPAVGAGAGAGGGAPHPVIGAFPPPAPGYDIETATGFTVPVTPGGARRSFTYRERVDGAGAGAGAGADGGADGGADAARAAALSRALPQPLPAATAAAAAAAADWLYAHAQVYADLSAVGRGVAAGLGWQMPPEDDGGGTGGGEPALLSSLTTQYYGSGSCVPAHVDCAAVTVILVATAGLRDLRVRDRATWGMVAVPPPRMAGDFPGWRAAPDGRAFALVAFTGELFFNRNDGFPPVEHEVIRVSAPRVSAVLRLYPPRTASLTSPADYLARPHLFVPRAIAVFRAACGSVHSGVEPGTLRPAERVVTIRTTRRDGSSVAVPVPPEATLADLRTALGGALPYAWERAQPVAVTQRVGAYSPATLLADFSFVDGETIASVWEPGSVTLALPSGGTAAARYWRSEPALALHLAAAEAARVSPGDIRLVYGGRELDPSRPVDLPLPLHGATVTVVPAGRG
jgi:hypothetical protein